MASHGEISTSPEYLFSWPVYSPFRRGFIVTTYLIPVSILRAVHGTLAGALVKADHLFAIRVTSAQIATLLLPFLVRLAVLFISIPLYAMATLQVVPDHLLAIEEKRRQKEENKKDKKTTCLPSGWQVQLQPSHSLHFLFSSHSFISLSTGNHVCADIKQGSLRRPPCIYM